MEMPPLQPAAPYRGKDGRIVVPAGLLLLAHDEGVREILFFDPDLRKTLRAEVGKIWAYGQATGRNLITPHEVWGVQP